MSARRPGGLPAETRRPLMFDIRNNHSFNNAPQSVTTFVATVLEPAITLLVYLAAMAWYDEPIGRADLTLCFLVLTLSWPGINRFRDRLSNAAVGILGAWLTLMAILLGFGYGTRILELFDRDVLLAWVVLKDGGAFDWPLGDDVPLVPSTQYGVFKCCNEGNARIYFQDHGISSVGLRPWTVYGVGRDLGMTSEPTKAIKAVLLGRPYHINFGGWTDFQYVDDVAKAFVLSLERPYSGAKSYNLRGAVVTLADFHAALAKVLPEAAKLVTYGTTQIAIAYDLSDAGITRDLGAMPKTALEAGIRETVAIFRQLQAEGRLDTADLDGPKPPPAIVVDEV